MAERHSKELQREVGSLGYGILSLQPFDFRHAKGYSTCGEIGLVRMFENSRPKESLSVRTSNGRRADTQTQSFECCALTQLWIFAARSSVISPKAMGHLYWRSACTQPALPFHGDPKSFQKTSLQKVCI